MIPDALTTKFVTVTAVPIQEDQKWKSNIFDIFENFVMEKKSQKN